MTRRNSWMPGAAWLLVVLLAALCLGVVAQAALQRIRAGRGEGR